MCHSKDIWPCFHKIVCSREMNPQNGYMQKQYSATMSALRELWNQWGCIAKGFCSIEAMTMISLLTRYIFLNITFIIFSSSSLSHTLSTVYGFVPSLRFFSEAGCEGLRYKSVDTFLSQIVYHVIDRKWFIHHSLQRAFLTCKCDSELELNVEIPGLIF